jgi:twitching motility two-component system response regulator PilH
LARRILLADDSVTAQNMGRRILTDAGYEVVTVNNGSAALKKIAENKPDLIVLDVYMPGYGGLEVCQRIKESTETSRIPVLLTVGKLEPFKPDEARRVRADAFIVKPFEATELLTALTKLEDMIVAQPQPQKSGRFARALAEVEQSATAERFGDRETGWKSRLIIPGPNLKPREAQAEPVEADAIPPRDLQRGHAGEAEEPKQEFERPIPAGLPADITPEEIAAITAAAATFGGKTEESVARPDIATPLTTQEGATPEPPVVEPSKSEPPAVTLASAPEADTEVQADVPAEPKPVTGEGEGMSEAVANIDAAKVEDQPPDATELPATAEVSETETTSETEVSGTEEPTASDAEVMAAIASLAPSNGHAIEGVRPASEGSNGNGQEAPAAIYASVASGTRWIAESVALAAHESNLVLEHEMEMAQAASAAAEAARSSSSVATAIEASVPVAVAQPAETAIVETPVVAESIAAAESIVTPVVAAVESVESPVDDSSEPAVASEEAAYAAAASAGSAVEHTSPVEAVAPAIAAPEVSQSKSPAELDTSPQREAELAAAWQNWKQIRESFVGQQPSSQPTEASIAETKSSELEVPAKPGTVEAAAESEEVETVASEAPAESSTIASIVDSMLAELRPKLVEEIAKKMNSEKKEKEKKKKK